MDDHNNDKNLDEFFNRTTKKEDQQEDPNSPKQEKTSYYYSYGPFKASQQDLSDNLVYRQDDQAPVEVTAPKPVRPLGMQKDQPEGQTQMSAWEYRKSRRSSFRTIAASVIAGALIMGSFMIASDKMNLFTNAGVLANGGTPAAGSVHTTSDSNNSGSLKNAAISDVIRPNNISQIYKDASPAVVKIETMVKARAGSSLGNDPLFQQFFGGDGSSGQSQDQQPQDNGGLQPAGMGSGFIFEKSGYILTNEHVVDGAVDIEVTVQGFDKKFKAKLLGNSFDLDLAVLKIEGTQDFPKLDLGKVEDMNIGDWVVAIGNPYGFDHTVTVGVLSSKERPIEIPDGNKLRKYQHLLQTDASINPGNSGGPLLNLSGEVIGINTAVSSQAQGIGFAIPTSTISSVLENLKNNVKIPKTPAPFIGVGLQDLDSSVLKELNLTSTDGAIITQIQRNSPGFKAGLKNYDVIQAINGVKVKNSAELVAAVQKLKVGDKTTLSIVRDGKQFDVAVVIGDRNADTAN